MNSSNRRYVADLTKQLIDLDILPVVVIGSGPMPEDRLVLLMPLLTKLFDLREAREMLVEALATVDKDIADDFQGQLFQKVTNPKGPNHA